MALWGIPPVFQQPLDVNVLRFAPPSHPRSQSDATYS